MKKYLTTQLAARFCAELGKPVSSHHLRKLRLKGPQDPGVQGPAWVRDSQTGYVLYDVEDLKRWVANWQSQLSATTMPKPQQLECAAA